MIYVAVGYHKRMCVPVAFQERQEAEEFLQANPNLLPTALFAFGDVAIDEVFLRNWEKFTLENSDLDLNYKEPIK